MRRWFARSTARFKSAEWTPAVVIISALAYGVVYLLVHPAMGVRTRLLGLPLVCFWAWRSGVLAGGLAALTNSFVLPDLCHWVTGVPVDEAHPGIIGISTIINASVGALIGRMATLGRRLRAELEARARAEGLLRESEECYRLLFDANPRPMWVVDRETMRFLAVNAAALGHYGYEMEELDRMGLASFLPPGDVPRPDLPGARQHRKKDGTIIDVELAVHPIAFHGREARLVVSVDVTEQLRARAALEHRAHHDALTGLPNRALFRSTLERAIEKSRGRSGNFAVFLMDLDRFKAINDTLGHAYGDQTLQEIGPRLREVLRQGDVLARLGGDEFGVYLRGADAEGAALVAARILDAFREPFVLDGRAFDVGTSIGIAIHPDHGDDLEALLHRADLAMYASKRAKAGPVIYSPEIDDHAPTLDDPLSLVGPIADDGGHELVG